MQNAPDSLDTHATELEAALSLISATLEATADAILVIGTDGAIKVYNQKFLQMWGLTEAHMASPRDAIPCIVDKLTDPEAFLAKVRALYAEPEAESRDILELLDGRIIERYSIPQRIGERVVGRVWNYRDITAQKLEEQARDLLQREKIEALEQANQLKNQFLGILSHELRTPLNAIMGFASVLEDGVAGELNEPQALYTGKILRSSELLLALVNDLLEMTRIQAGKFSLNPAPMSLPAVLDEVVGTLAPLAEQKELTLASEVPVSLPVVLGDAQRVGQVLFNLIGNAIKFTPEGGRITVRAGTEGAWLRVEVLDTGVGISGADIERLFSPFTQLDMSDTRAAGGVGLGLAIARALIEAHSGAIGVQSAPGEGSTFWFTLPLG